MRKKIQIWCGLCLLVVVGVAVTVRHGLAISYNDSLFAFTHDIADYLDENDYCLPSSWQEFGNWHWSARGSKRWLHSDLAGVVSLPWGHQLIRSDVGLPVIEVTEGERQYLQDDMNALLWRRVGGNWPRGERAERP